MTYPTTNAYIALGSNIEPSLNIPRCLDLLREIPDSTLTAESSWYRTSPWGLREQADFVNLVVGLATGLPVRALLSATQDIERRLARIRGRENGPRTIDLDILLFGATTLDTDDLTIPHPGLLIRDFMLIPLIEIAPEADYPGQQRPVSDLTEHIRYRQILGKHPSRSP